jgi:hypothetical protein
MLIDNAPTEERKRGLAERFEEEFSWEEVR